jgi:hypothetical protein
VNTIENKVHFIPAYLIDKIDFSWLNPTEPKSKQFPA